MYLANLSHATFPAACHQLLDWDGDGNGEYANLTFQGY